MMPFLDFNVFFCVGVKRRYFSERYSDIIFKVEAFSEFLISFGAFMEDGERYCVHPVDYFSTRFLLCADQVGQMKAFCKEKV